MTKDVARVADATSLTSRRISQELARWSLPIILVALVLIAAITTSAFLTFDNFRGVLINTSITGIVAVGMTAFTLSGNFFSMAAGQSTMLAAVIYLEVASSGASPWFGAVLAIVVLIAIGVIQALVIAEGLNPIITTLATGTIIYGLVTWRTNGAVIDAPHGGAGLIATGTFLGVPALVYVFFIFTAVTSFWIERTVSGRHVVLVGANRLSARVSGLSVRMVTIWAVIVMSVGMAVAGILSAGELGQVTANSLPSLSVDAIAAVLVGGTAIQGGEGSPIRTAIGALIIVILQNVMILHSLTPGAQIFAEGILVVVVVVALHLLRRVGAQ